MGSSTRAGRCMYDFLSLSFPPAKTHLIPRAWLALLFVVCCWTQKGDYCNQIITDKHLNELQDLIDTQMMNACKVSFEYIDEKQLNKPICFVKAAFPQLNNILDKMVYKKNSSNFEKAKNVRDMYTKIDENEEICIEEQDEEEKELSQACVKKFSTPPEEMLGLVKKFFSKVKDLLDQKVDFRQDCSDTYRKLCSASKKQETSSLDQRRKEAKLKESNWEPLIYTLAVSILAVLLAVGGLLFYKHKSRTLERQLQMRGNDLEQQEGRLLHEAQACLELQVQREL
ncbi:PREDICTED: macrophage colony-stimulating factor 1 isoform X2 [Gavialis gangeticus]|uniref:macrophage colony-stimulating factor 1 isoform X2 n=1 Tax=Gavialis gangeticus TaxID=94835 RepID=UPI00092EDBC8|nr:PREDICTED: macrophage colony-stimulating factor 1 isoform X2 [Gavialis gangeticus]